MSLQLFTPPKNHTDFEKSAQELVEAMNRLKFEYEVQGFLLAWANNLRVIVDRDDSGTIVGILLLMIGVRWTDGKNKATVMGHQGDFDKLYDFARSMSIAAGAESIIVEMPNPKQAAENMLEYTLREEIL